MRLELKLDLYSFLNDNIIDEKSAMTWQGRFSKELEENLSSIRFPIRIDGEIVYYIRFDRYNALYSLYFEIVPNDEEKDAYIDNSVFNKQINEFIMFVQDILNSGTWSVVPKENWVIVREEFDCYFVDNTRRQNEPVLYKPILIIDAVLDNIEDKNTKHLKVEYMS